MGGSSAPLTLHTLRQGQASGAGPASPLLLTWGHPKDEKCGLTLPEPLPGTWQAPRGCWWQGAEAPGEMWARPLPEDLCPSWFYPGWWPVPCAATAGTARGRGQAQARGSHPLWLRSQLASRWAQKGQGPAPWAGVQSRERRLGIPVTFTPGCPFQVRPADRLAAASAARSVKCQRFNTRAGVLRPACPSPVGFGPAKADPE